MIAATYNKNFIQKNNYNKNFKYGLSFNGNFFDIRDRDFGESKLNANAFVNIMVNNIGIESSADYITQQLTNNLSGKTKYDYFNLNSRAVLKVNNTIQVKAGINLGLYDDNTFFAPSGSIAIKLNDAFTFFGEYSPGTQFLSVSDFKGLNRYSVADSTDNIVQKVKHKFNTALRYQFIRYVEISVGASYSVFDNYLYFQDTLFTGLFNSSSLDDVNKFAIYTNIMFHMGPAGYLYTAAAFNNVENSDNKIVPYNPKITASAVYGYAFDFGLSLRSKINYRSSSFSDLENNSEIPQYFDLSLMFEYELNNNLRITFDLINLINRKNFIWSGYREMKFDFIAGVDYRW